MFQKSNKLPLILVAAFTLVSCRHISQLSGESGALSAGYYVFKSRSTGKCLDVPAGKIDDGLRLQQWDCNGTAAQRFQLIATDDLYYRIRNVASGKELDIVDKSTKDGAAIQQWSWGNTENQQWRFVKRDQESYAVIGRASGRVLDVIGNDMASGAKIQIWTDYNATNQQWFLERHDVNAPVVKNPSGTYPPVVTTPPVVGKPPVVTTPPVVAQPPVVSNPPVVQVPSGNVLVKVTNQCPFNIWVHAAGKQATLQPDDALLAPSSSRSYSAPGLWESARVEAYVDGPRSNQLDKVEMTFDKTGQGQQALNYNVTYVDWVGLPVKVSSIGDGGDCKAAGCARPVAQLLNGCPTELLEGRKCLSARTFCLNPVNSGKASCQLLNGKISECVSRYGDCAGAAGSTTADVYACSGSFFSQNPKYCAAINRGMLDDPMNANIGTYYKKGPFNSYSKWVHDVCPGIYALAYDDFPPAAEESGYHSCTQGRELDITFCPGG